MAALYIFHESPAHTFGNTFVADALADVLKFLSCVTVALTLAYSRSYLTERGLFRGETFALMMFALLGMMVMISANHFLLLYLGLELMSLSLYAMIALQRESGQAVEAAMKYFVLGALSSGLLLYGMSMIYGATPDVARVATTVFAGGVKRRCSLSAWCSSSRPSPSSSAPFRTTCGCPTCTRARRRR